jgi:hypothetical protein
VADRVRPAQILVVASLFVNNDIVGEINLNCSIHNLKVALALFVTDFFSALIVSLHQMTAFRSNFSFPTRIVIFVYLIVDGGQL